MTLADLPMYRQYVDGPSVFRDQWYKTCNLDLNAKIEIHILNVIYLEATKIE